MPNKWFWISTDLDAETWDMGRLGSILFFYRPEQISNTIFVFSIQILMFHLYIGRFGDVVKYWHVKFEHWNGWWKHV